MGGTGLEPATPSVKGWWSYKINAVEDQLGTYWGTRNPLMTQV